MAITRKICLSVKRKLSHSLSENLVNSLDAITEVKDKVPTEIMLYVFDNVDDPVYDVTNSLDSYVSSELKSETDKLNFVRKKASHAKVVHAKINN